jgi:hypothetical protein
MVLNRRGGAFGQPVQGVRFERVVVDVVCGYQNSSMRAPMTPINAAYG